MYEITVTDSNGNIDKIRYDQLQHALYLDDSDVPLSVRNEHKQHIHSISNCAINIYNDDKDNLFGEKSPDDNLLSINRIKSLWQLRILIGKKCNFGCDYCYQPKDYKDAHHSFNLARRLKRVVGSFSKVNDIGLWGGEPLIYLDKLEDIIKQFKVYETKEHKLNFNICTNGWKLKDHDVQEFLLKYKPHITISYDGPGQSLRGIDIFDYPEITGFIHRYSALNDDNNISLNPVMTKLNNSYVKYFDKVYSKLGTGRFTIGEGKPIMLSSRNDFDIVIRPEDMPNLSKEMFKCLFDRKYEIMFSNVLSMNVMNFIQTLNIPPKLEDTTCFAGHNKTLVVDTDGNMLPCQTFSYNEIDKDTGKHYSYGNIDQLESNLDRVPLPDLTKHVSRKSKKCIDCLLCKMCNGTCPFAPNDLFEANCHYFFYHYLPIFQYAIYKITNKIVTEFRKID